MDPRGVSDDLSLSVAQLSVAESNPSPSRRPYHGSCRCGSVKYVAFLSFPPVTGKTGTPSSGVRIYRCNCSICHKTGYLHVRLESSPDDFILLSPIDPETGALGLGDYVRSGGKTHRYFCKTCGVRCFSFQGTGELAEVAVEGLGKPAEGEDGKTMTVWRPKKEGWKEGMNCYLSVNAVTLEPGQEGLDLKEWTEKKWIWYLDKLNDVDEQRIGEPYDGGCY